MKKIRVYKALSWLVLLAPITAVFCINASDYFTLENGLLGIPQGYQVSIGVIASLGCGILLATGKTNLFKGSRGFLIGLVLAVLLKAIINDIILILGALTVGSVGYGLFQPKINDLKEIYKEERSATIQAKVTEAVIQKVRNGAV
jgi:ribose/xylose/arabinose/galactoside ABC-type transport system permease subunit